MLFAFTIYAQPTDNATDPPARESSDVIGVYGDSYDNIAGINYDPNWGQSGHTLVNTAFDPGTGSLILAYPTFNYQGTEFIDMPQDASLMEFLHVDIWVPMGTDRLVKITPIDNSGVGASEILVEVPLVPGSWNSIDLPKIAFADMSWNSVIQMKFDGQFNGDGSANTDPFDIYVDNIYFWKTATAEGTDITLSDLQIDGATIAGFASGKTNYSVGLPSGTVDAPQVTLVTTTDANATSSITQATNIPSDATIDVTGGNGTTMQTYTISFFIGTPNSSPPSPTNAQEDVISIYSDAFTNIDGINYDPNWGQSGHTMVNPDFDPGTGNLALAYPNFNYQGTDFLDNAQNASAMEFLHVDIWVAAGTDRTVKVTPIDNSGVGATEILVEVPLMQGGWNSIDLPKSAFADMSWNSVIQMKVDGQFNSDGSANTDPYDIYLDNIYFWKESTASGTDATLSDLQVDGITIPGFNPEVTSYSYGVSSGPPTPMISATTADLNATTEITQVSNVPGFGEVIVTSANGMVVQNYVIDFFLDAPGTGAPDPSDQESAVISLFSDSYTDVEVDTWNTVWSDATFEDVMIDGNPTKKYTALGFNGIETVNAPVDASDMMHINMDIWSPNMDEIRIKLVDFLGDGFGGANDDTEAELTLPVTKGEWMNIKIPLSDFSDGGMSSFSDINQYIISSVPFGTGILFVDNVYFSKMVSSSEDLDERHLVKVYPNPVNLNGTLYLSETVKNIEVMSLHGQLLRTSSATSIDLGEIASGAYLVRITTINGEKQISKIIIR